MIEATLRHPAEHLASTRPLTMTWNPNRRVEMKTAIAFGDRGLLKVTASASEALSCQHPETPQGQEWFAFEVDPGALGDYYMGRSTPADVSFALTGDVASWRETYNAHSRFELVPFGPNDETTELRAQWRRVLHNPDPPVMTQVSAQGAMTVSICQSARDILTVTTRPVSTEPVHVDLGYRSFSPQSAIVFMFDDGKNGQIVSAVALYEAPTIDCEAATRALSDDGGGVSGLQLETSQVAGSPGGMALGVLQPMGIEAYDVTTGGEYFAQRALLHERVYGSIAFTAASFVEQGGVASGFIHVDGHSNPQRPADLFISGTFQARICKRDYW
jgi:hypothetical protein